MGRAFGLSAVARVCVLCTALALSPLLARSQVTTTTTYTYDALGRLTSTANDDGSGVSTPVVYAYDPAGNRVAVTNGVGARELDVAAFSASSPAGAAIAPPSMRDGKGDAPNTAHVTQDGADQWIMADLGAPKVVSTVSLMAADLNYPPYNADQSEANGAVLQSANDLNGTWTTHATLSGVPTVGYYPVVLSDVSARYWRVLRQGSGVVALGDFRLYSNSSGPSTAPGGGGGGPRTFQVEASKYVIFDWTTLMDGTPPYTLLTERQLDYVKGHTSAMSDPKLVRYRAYATSSGSEKLTLQARDATNQTVEGEVTFNIVPSTTNDPPRAVDDHATVENMDSVTLYPLLNDYDIDDDALHLVSAGPAHFGNVVWNSTTGAVTFTSIGIGGETSFPYVIGDARGLVGQGTITIDVVQPAGNRAPRTQDDTRLVTMNTPITFRPQLNDRELDGDPITIVAVSDPPHGSAVIGAGGGNVTYTPDTGFLGEDSFTYTVSDGRGGTATATVRLTVSTQPNRAPIAVSDTFRPDFGTHTGFGPMDNDYDPDGDDLFITGVTAAAHGQTSNGPLDHVSYLPDRDYVGPDSFQYTISDGRGGLGTGVINVVVGPPPNNNFPATPHNDAITVMANTTYQFDPTSNDVDPEGDLITLLSVTAASHGTVVLGADKKTVVYTPAAEYSGADSFTYMTEDGHRIGTVSITVLPNQAPTAVNDNLPVGMIGGVYNFDPRANDLDPEGNTLTVIAVGTAAHGTTSIASSGAAIIYSPTVGYVGSDSFTYTISDGHGGTSSATVSLSVPPNHAPVAVNDSTSVASGKRLVFDPRANDIDEDADLLTITVVSSPAHGQVAIVNSGGQIAYRPAAGYIGSEILTYTVIDNRGGSSTASINISVLPHRMLTITPAVNGKTSWDLDADGDLVLATAGGWTITPSATFSIPVKAWGGSGGKAYSVASRGGAGGYAYGVVTVQNGTAYNLYVGGGGASNVAGQPLGGLGGPFASSGGGFSGLLKDQGFVPLLVAGGGGGAGWSDSDSSGGAGGGAIGQAGSAPAGGTAGQGGTQTTGGYTPQQPMFGGFATDPGGGGGAGYRGGGAGSGPSAHGGGGGGGSGYFDPASVTNAVLLGGAGVTPGNAADADRGSAGAPLADSDVGAAGKTIVFGLGLASPAGTNGAPVATDDSVTVATAHTAVINARANDSDPELDDITITTVGTPAHGVASITSGGSLNYISNTGYVGPDSFTYAISDGRGGTATATVNVTVGVNATPVANSDSISALADVAYIFDPRTNDSDADGDALTITVVTTPAHGTAAIVSSGAGIRYTAAGGYVGSDTFTYTVSDGWGGTASATVVVSVTASNRTFTISPAVAGKTVWNLDVDGALNLGASGTWTITPTSSFASGVKAWGAGGTNTSSSFYGGGGGYAAGTVSLQTGTTYTLIVGAVSGGGASATGSGGGYTGLKSGSTAVLIAGGGGGGGFGGLGGAGGGATGQDGTSHSGDNTQGRGGSASAGGAGGAGAGSAGSSFTGGAGGTSTGSFSGGGGGGGFYGGGGGGYAGGSGAGGGGGGSSYANPAQVASSILTAGSGTAPGNSNDAARNGAGANNGPGRFIIGVNVAPVAVNDSVSTHWASPVTLDPRANDDDLDGNPLSITALGSPTHGAATIGGGGTFVTYTATANYVGADNFTYTVSDGQGGAATATISVNVTATPNQAPTAVADSINLTHSGLTFNPRANDTDPDSDLLTIVAVGSPAHGTAVVVSNGASIMYTPSSSYAGSDSFTYTISDGRGGSSTATIAVTVAANNVPSAANDNRTVYAGQATSLDPRTNDTDADNDTLTITAVGTPSHGTVTIASGGVSISYTPTNGYTGADSFTYTVSDGFGGTATAMVNVTVNPPAVTWNPADKNANVTLSNGNLTLSTSAADASVRSTLARASGKYYYEATITTLLAGSNDVGVATSSANLGSYVGANAYSYGFAADGKMYANASVVGTGSTFATGDVIGVAVDLDAHKIWWSKNGAWIGNPATGVGGLTLSNGTYFAAASGGNGAVTTGNFGASAFAYTTPPHYASWDGVGVTSTNVSPVAANDNVTVFTGGANNFDPRTNDTDSDGDALTITAVGAPSHGVATIASGGASISYTPTTGYTGADSFTYTVSDGYGGTSTATINLTVSVSTKTFTISPAVSGKTSWNLDTDGPLNLGSSGTWTLTPTGALSGVVKAWGAGGNKGYIAGGGGGYATGTVSLQSGTAYTLIVGAIGGGGPSATGSGGGYTGLKSGSTAVLIAGGGGGGGFGGLGGAGGGATGQDGTSHSGDNTQGRGGSASAGGAGGAGAGSAGSSFTGGAGGTSTGSFSGGGGGGGFYGGGGGGYAGSSGAGGGGGGSSYANPAYVTSPTLTAGSGTTPGNSSDTARSGAGGGDGNGAAGRFILSAN